MFLSSVAHMTSNTKSSTGLPSLGLYESNRYRKDDHGMDRYRNDSNNASSPTSYRANGSHGNAPPPPPPPPSGLSQISPQDLRNLSKDDRPAPPQERQQLPSIHEALRDSINSSAPSTRATAPPPPPPPSAASNPSSLQVSTTPYMHAPTYPASTEPPRRILAPDPPSISKQNSQQNSPTTLQHSPVRTHHVPPPPPPPLFTQPPKPASHSGISPPTPTARPSPMYPPPGQQSASYEAPPQSAPPHGSYPYSGYPQYAYPPGSNPAYSPGAMSAPPQYSAPTNYRDYPPAPIKIENDQNIKRKLSEFQLDRMVGDVGNTLSL
jgi:hypothetical protein